MTITVGEWGNTVDPYRTPFTLSGSVTFSANTMRIATVTGIFSLPIDGTDVEVVFLDDNDPDNDFQPEVQFVFGNGAHTNHYSTLKREDSTGALRTFFIWATYPAKAEAWSVSFAGQTLGPNTYSLFAWFAYNWLGVDPAQAIFSLVVHYPVYDGGIDPKNFLDKTSFEDASNYYDKHTCALSFHREKGKTVAEMVKTVIEHTGDFLTIAPHPSTGVVYLRMRPRAQLDRRTTPIDLDSSSVSTFKIRRTDRHTLDGVRARAGSYVAIGSTSQEREGDFIFNLETSGELPSEEGAFLTQRVRTEEDSRIAEVELPFYVEPEHSTSHVDLQYWKDDQEEIEVTFADLSHLNFEAGDDVAVLGRGFDGTEHFLVYEKEFDPETLTATARLLRLHGMTGTKPAAIDRTQLFLSLRPNYHGAYFNSGVGSSSLPAEAYRDALTQPYGAWMDESGNHHNAHEMTRGTLANPNVAENVFGEWPGAQFSVAGKSLSGDRNTAASGTNARHDTTAASDFTIYVVMQSTSLTNRQYIYENLDTATAHDLKIFSESSGGGFKFGDVSGGTYGSSTTGFVLNAPNIVTFVLDGSGANKAKIRINGVDVSTGLNYTRTQLKGDEVGIGCSAAGTQSIDDALGELHIFTAVHSTTDVDAVEASLAEKYGISI